jgi:hypothetical protein
VSCTELLSRTAEAKTFDLQTPRGPRRARPSGGRPFSRGLPCFHLLRNLALPRTNRSTATPFPRVGRARKRSVEQDLFEAYKAEGSTDQRSYGSPGVRPNAAMTMSAAYGEAVRRRRRTDEPRRRRAASRGREPIVLLRLRGEAHRFSRERSPVRRIECEAAFQLSARGHRTWWLSDSSGAFWLWLAADVLSNSLLGRPPC